MKVRHSLLQRETGNYQKAFLHDYAIDLNEIGASGRGRYSLILGLRNQRHSAEGLARIHRRFRPLQSFEDGLETSKKKKSVVSFKINSLNRS
jgi:hypothetical protein